METDDRNIVDAILGGEPIPGEGNDDNGNAPGNGDGQADTPVDNNGDDKPYEDNEGRYHFAKVFGKEYSHPEKIKAAINRSSQFTPETEKELTELRSFKGTAEAQLAELNKKPIYKNPTLYKLDRIFDEDPKNYPLIQSFALGKVSDLDLIKADYKNRYPELAEKDEDLNLMLENEYGAIFDEDVDVESKEYKAAMMKLKMRATDLRQNIQAKLDKIEVPDPEKITATRKEAMDKLVTAWKPAFASIQKEFTKVPITVPDEKDPGKEVEFLSIDVPEAEREQYYKLALNHITANNLMPENGGAEAVANLIRKMYVINNFPTIIAKVAEAASTSVNGKWRERIHNTRKAGSQPGDHQRNAGDVSDALMEKMKSDGQF